MPGEVEFHHKRLVIERLAVVKRHQLLVHFHCLCEQVVPETFVNFLGAIPVCANGTYRGRRAVLRGHAVGIAMIPVARTEKVDENVGIEVLVHRDGEDVFSRIFVVYREIVAVIVLQPVAVVAQLVAPVNAGLPGVERFFLANERDVLTFRVEVVCPVVIGPYFGVKSHFCQDEIGHATGDTTVVVAFPIAALVCKVGECRGELLPDVVEERATADLLRIAQVGSG